MTAEDLAKLLAKQIAQGKGHLPVSIFQWQHGSELVTEVIYRSGLETIEIYSGTVPSDTQHYPPAPEQPGDDIDDLI